jgi:hypothetical protein
VPHIPPLQVLWLVIYWAGLLPVATLLTVALTTDEALQSKAALLLAFVAHVIGATWATRLARAHLDSTAWVKGTTTIRVIAVAWLGIAAFILIGSVVSTLLLIDVGDDGEALGFVSTVGSVSLLAMIGPGYAEYREAKSAVAARA